MKDIFGEITPDAKDLEKISKLKKKEQYEGLKNRIESYKHRWDKDGIIQFKSEHIAILQRKYGFQVEFLIAFEDITKEGYRLRAIDAGKTADGGGFMGGMNSYFYFQKTNYVR